ncbi:GNAT family N-acetyltransferase [Demequina gelatinilytica]|uniref:GNAT family N-acetyltransferase n=1 Tax=Demequina gelatinilytica TaxID=1638980 RepID=UPI000785B211|nr:GNAT family N-acetyltransferase [Demequina gelatinilytica]
MGDSSDRIRPAVGADGAALAAFASELALGARPSPSAAADALSALLVRADAAVLVAERAGTPVGYLVVQRQPAMFAGGAVAVITELYVASERRGEGLGRALVEAAEAAARRWAVACMWVATSRAQGFYESLGFAATATFLKKPLG